MATTPVYQPFVQINASFLADLGGSRLAPPPTRAGWASTLETLPYKEAVHQHIAQNLTQYDHWLWMDPQTCLTIPFWEQVLPGFTPLIVLRHPVEVALAAANDTGLYRDLSLTEIVALWETYYARVAATTNPAHTLWVHHIQLTQQPQATLERVLQQLGIAAEADQIERAATIPQPTDELSMTLVPEHLQTDYARYCAYAGHTPARTGDVQAMLQMVDTRLQTDPARQDDTQRGPITALRIERRQQQVHIRSLQQTIEGTVPLALRARQFDVLQRSRIFRLANKVINLWRIRKRTFGRRLGRSQPAPIVDIDWYTATYPDAVASDLPPDIHYDLFGRYLGYRPNAYFDPVYYLAENTDLMLAGVDPLDHYITYGWHEGRQPGPDFDPAFYLRYNPDVRAAGIEPLSHYVRYGRYEGRTPSPDFAKFVAGKRLLTLDERYDMHPALPPPTIADDGAFLVSQMQAKLIHSQFVITVSHNDYLTVTAGVQVIMRDEEAAWNQRATDYVQVAPYNPKPTLARDDEVFYVRVNINGEWVADAPGPVVMGALQAIAARRTVPHVILHHLMGTDMDWVQTLVREVGKRRALFWVHDYFSLCVNYNLTRNDREYCHAPAPDSGACRICVYGGARVGHLAQFQALFTDNEITVIAPSQMALDIWKRQGFPYADTLISPHIRLEPAKPTPALMRLPLRIAYVGQMAVHKGYGLWEKLLAQFQDDPRYAFYHLAEGTDPDLPHIHVPVRVTPQNRDAMRQTLIDQQIDVAFLGSIVPETFSLTLHEALAAGCFVLTHHNSGNIQRVVYETGE
jgi:hypothetical protein